MLKKGVISKLEMLTLPRPDIACRACGSPFKCSGLRISPHSHPWSRGTGTRTLPPPQRTPGGAPDVDTGSQRAAES